METEKRRKFLINFSYFSVILLLGFCVLRYVIPMTMPFVIGFLIAYSLRGFINAVSRKLNMPRKAAAILVVLMFYATVGSLLTLLGLKAISWLAALVGNIPMIYEVHVQPFLMDVLYSLEVLFTGLDLSVVSVMESVGAQLIQSLGKMVSNASVGVMGFATVAASSLPGLFVKLVLIIISSFFIAIDYDQLAGFCLRQMGEKTKAVFLEIKAYVVGTLWVCIRSYLLIMSLTFVELSIGLNLLKINHAILIAFCIAIFDILPVLGTGGIMIPWTVLTAITGDYHMALGLLLIYLVITVIRNIVEPKIVGSQLGLHPVVTLVSMFVGVQFFGVIGLFGFPILLSLLRHLDENGVIHILK